MKKKKYLRIEIANVGSSILVALGGVLTEKVSSDTRSNSSRHCRRLSEINSIERLSQNRGQRANWIFSFRALLYFL